MGILLGERNSKGDHYGNDVADMFVPKQLGIAEIFTLYGSVLPRCLGHATFGALLSGLLKAYDADITEYQEYFYHPYTLGIFANVLGFSLVMRLQIAYQRLWEGASQCHQASSKWADAVMQVVAFDEASRDAFDEQALEFRMLFIHYASLMHACALIDMRQDDHIDHRLALNQEDPFLFRPNTTPNLYQAKDVTAVKASDGSEYKGSATTGNLASSSRNHSVPLQMVLITRQQLQKRTGELPCNSFAAIPADEKAVRPQTYAPSTADRSGHQVVRSATTRPLGSSGRMTGATVSKGKARLNQGALSMLTRFANLFVRNASSKGVVELTRANKFDVVGGVAESELALLQHRSPGSRVFRVQTWLFRLMTNRLLAGGLAIPPPLLSRTYQVLSDGTAAAVQGRKVAHVEFPFALRQLLAVLLTVFIVLAPMFIAAFMDSVALCTGAARRRRSLVVLPCCHALLSRRCHVVVTSLLRRCRVAVTLPKHARRVAGR